MEAYMKLLMRQANKPLWENCPVPCAPFVCPYSEISNFAPKHRSQRSLHRYTKSGAFHCTWSFFLIW